MTGGEATPRANPPATPPKDGGRDAKAGSGIEGTDVEDPLDPAVNPGLGRPANDQDDLAGADVTGGGVANRDPG